jgi:pimeloyl-ACP methyl ester carboxylesterase
MHIDIEKNMEIHGSKQYVSIRSKKSDAPLLLYLHGGPGDAALPLVLKYNKELENYFTVVVWEQRGAGKSYYKFEANNELTIDTFVEDTYALVQSLLTQFNQDKLYLVGHSWGSIIGLKFIIRHPELIHTYIGCGQVIHMKKSSQLSYEYAMQKNLEKSNNKIVEKLKSIDYLYTGENWLNDLLFTTKQVVKFEGSLYGKTNYNNFIWEFITSNKYNLRDLVNRQKGSLQAIEYFWQELMGVDFENHQEFEVPIVFIEGRYDYHVSSTMVRDFFEAVKTEKEFHWFDQSCHFPQWSEADKFNNILISLLEN